VREESLTGVEATLFSETPTFGLRRFPVERTVLTREHVEVDTPWGPVRMKLGRYDDLLLTASPEHDDCARVAREASVTLREVDEAARRAWAASADRVDGRADPQ
jgi:uncharacterized protein (DUF111 family)